MAIINADVALLDDDLGALAALLRLGAACKRIIWGNIAMAMAIKLIVLVLAVDGAVQLWFAVVADVGALLIVVANGMRLLSFDFEAASSVSRDSLAIEVGRGSPAGNLSFEPNIRGSKSKGAYQPLLHTSFPQQEGQPQQAVASYGAVQQQQQRVASV